MTPRKLIFLVASVIALLLLMVPLANVLSSSLVTTAEKPNPQGTHSVELQKNIRQKTIYFRIKSNGHTIFRSPNFRRVPVDFREQIVWAPDGKRFFFEVADKRLYGYDAAEQRELSAEEVFAIPLSEFFQTGYNGTPLRHPDAPPEDEIYPSWLPDPGRSQSERLLPRSPNEKPIPAPKTGEEAAPAFDFPLKE